MTARFTFTASLIASAFAVPDLQHNWRAAASQDMEGNISGVRPGITLYNEFYHQELGSDRYDYYDRRTPKTEIYKYLDFDSQTGCGKVYSFTDSSCCWSLLTEDDGSCSSFFTQQPTKKSVDMGLTEKGEDWQSNWDHLGFTQREDYFINEDLSINAWYQYIAIGADGDAPQWCTVNIDYSNIAVGTNDESTFAVPESCTKTCMGEELMFDRHQVAKMTRRSALQQQKMTVAEAQKAYDSAVAVHKAAVASEKAAMKAHDAAKKVAKKAGSKNKAAKDAELKAETEHKKAKNAVAAAAKAMGEAKKALEYAKKAAKK